MKLTADDSQITVLPTPDPKKSLVSSKSDPDFTHGHSLFIKTRPNHTFQLNRSEGRRQDTGARIKSHATTANSSSRTLGRKCRCSKRRGRTRVTHTVSREREVPRKKPAQGRASRLLSSPSVFRAWIFAQRRRGIVDSLGQTGVRSEICIAALYAMSNVVLPILASSRGKSGLPPSHVRSAFARTGSTFKCRAGALRMHA